MLRVAKKINDDEDDGDDNFEIRVAKPKSRGVKQPCRVKGSAEAAAEEGEVRRLWKHLWNGSSQPYWHLHPRMKTK
ncbi:unnamed protein product [Lasius platythorax]|uniref:Uncharacterized protein n=1 Tax=Lasius platythorax TaxID=488582 RepID=A0AAV2N7F1_9HYME